MTKMIHQYVMGNVNGQRAKVGVLVGHKDSNDHVSIGWSRANASKGDKFESGRGIGLAVERSKATEIVPLPHSMAMDFERFRARCEKYFKSHAPYARLQEQS